MGLGQVDTAPGAGAWRKQTYEMLSGGQISDMSTHIRLRERTMSRIWPTCLSATSVAGLAVVLSGCTLEPAFLYELKVQNELGVPVSYCHSADPASCTVVIPSGQTHDGYFLTHSRVRAADEAFELFDLRAISICGRLIGVNDIRAMSPVIRNSDTAYRIVLDDRVGKVCHPAGDS